jgi:hypothetical protein
MQPSNGSHRSIIRGSPKGKRWKTRRQYQAGCSQFASTGSDLRPGTHASRRSHRSVAGRVRWLEKKCRKKPLSHRPPRRYRRLRHKPCDLLDSASADSLSSPICKFFLFAADPNQIYIVSRPAPQRGARAIVTDAARDAVDAGSIGREATALMPWRERVTPMVNILIYISY